MPYIKPTDNSINLFDSWLVCLGVHPDNVIHHKAYEVDPSSWLERPISEKIMALYPGHEMVKAVVSEHRLAYARKAIYTRYARYSGRDAALSAMLSELSSAYSGRATCNYNKSPSDVIRRIKEHKATR